MSHYKALDNSLHFIDSDAFEYLLPAGSVQITDDEAEVIRVASIVVDPKDAITMQIKGLESQITPRRVRDALLGDNTFVRSIEAQIAELRAEIRALVTQ